MNNKTYIKMCEKAEKIQENHKWEYGDYFVAEHTVWCIGSASFHYQNVEDGVPIRDILPIASMQTDDLEGATISDSYIWLPRQDQLQEMIQEHRRVEWYEGCKCLTEPFVMLDDFTDWVLEGDGHDWTHEQEDVSMEQLWLAFVMKEKYNKIWNGEKEEWSEDSSRNIRRRKANV